MSPISNNMFNKDQTKRYFDLQNNEESMLDIVQGYFTQTNAKSLKDIDNAVDGLLELLNLRLKAGEFPLFPWLLILLFEPAFNQKIYKELDKILTASFNEGTLDNFIFNFDTFVSYSKATLTLRTQAMFFNPINLELMACLIIKIKEKHLSLLTQNSVSLTKDIQILVNLSQEQKTFKIMEKYLASNPEFDTAN